MLSIQPQIRITDPQRIDRNAILRDIDAGIQVIVQFSGQTYTRRLLEELNELCSELDDNFTLRFYTLGRTTYDGRILRFVPNVKSLQIDSQYESTHGDSFTELTELKKLNVVISDLAQKEILQSENLRRLEYLGIGSVKTKALNLEYLRDYNDLTSLMINGQIKNIEAVGSLPKLKELHLHSLPKIPLHFINELKGLRKLSILLGGRENILEIEENEIEDLSIDWVRGFNNLDNISNFRNLKSLNIENLIKLKSLHFDEALPRLDYLRILNCKTFESLTGVQNLPILDELRIVETALDFDQFMTQPLPESLNELAFYAKSEREIKEIGRKLETLGYSIENRV
ncbi:hypothetical protein [Phaeocystidibacter luteus]|uniref:Leucine-rich repeat domain-containing protein n=1 Tax=Phaeocystidibacter luteus TaxID=911197 RepID=A0A6N6REA2_9FLAO|nr:hypothetical protein [Phaeocystidibacter luteus]KAB2807715.1 hypothetical protein F8C67_11790 [Phaeocystidibacter luteus]